MKNKDEKKNENELEIVVGDKSVLNISEVNDCMNTLRPKSASSKSKNLIFPTAKGEAHTKIKEEAPKEKFVENIDEYVKQVAEENSNNSIEKETDTTETIPETSLEALDNNDENDENNE